MATKRKLAYTKQWKTVKDLADKNMKARLKTDKKDADGDKAELQKVLEVEKAWKSLYGDFSMNLSGTLKALENAETEADQAKYCKDTVKICETYSKRIDKFIAQFPEKGRVDIGNTTTILDGMLTRIRVDAAKGVR